MRGEFLNESKPVYVGVHAAATRAAKLRTHSSAVRTQPLTDSMRASGRAFGFLLIGGFLAAGVLALTLVVEPSLRLEARRMLLFGSPLLELQAPLDGQWVAQGQVEIIVRFPAVERTSSPTFRCLLNGHDVTTGLTRAENGAAGSVLGAIEGENHLRIEVFGRPWWGGPFLEDSLELRFHVRALPTLDRA